MFRKMLAVMLVAGIAGVGMMLALTPSVDAQASPSATRSFSPQEVEPSGQVVVTINAANYGVGGAVTETLPEGFTYVSSTLPDGQTGVTGQEIRFILAGETSFTYTVDASSVGGSHTFSGNLRDSDRNDHAVGGDTTVTVSSREPLVARYDDNNNGTIEKSEVIAAINDYLFGEGDEAISKSDVIKLINLYLFGPSTPPNPPGAPTGLTAAGNGQTRMDLSWSAPASDGGAAITGYRVEVSENGSTWIDLVANTRNADTSYSHTGLTAGSTRHYRVSAINSAGTGPVSNIATGTTDTSSQPGPDLVVETPTVDDGTPDAGASFTLSATVRNQGSGSSGSTTLRYYRSTDASITTSDTFVGTDTVGGLSASAASDQSISVTAPSTPGTYYYGACVGPVSDESDPGNNCSSAVAVTVGVVTAGDYDGDNDGLIEVSNLTQLNAIRWDLDGDGESRDSGYTQAFPGAVAGMGCPYEGCFGYELISDLDFDTNGNGQLDAGDAYWNGGAGWKPISGFGFEATFDGADRTIANLYINRSTESSVGLFGSTDSDSVIRKVGLVSASVKGNNEVGSFVGDHRGKIESSYATGSVNGNSEVGGLVGSVYGSTIENSYTTSSVTGTEEVGGLVGGSFSSGVIVDSHATGNVTGNSDVGGLIGSSWRVTVRNSYATGSVTGTSGNIGGLVGETFASVTVADSYATGSVIGTNEVGGLVGGGSSANISNSYSTGDVTGTGEVGGLIGSAGGTITGSYATGTVTATGNELGGLVGTIWGASITGSYATGNVTTGGNEVGGLVGGSFSSGTITASYATGSVNGNREVGGVLGSSWGVTIRNSYAIGAVSGNDDVGGLVGDKFGSRNNVISSYWDTQSTGQLSSVGGAGQSTSQLQSPTSNTGIYVDWNADWWDFGTSSQYPVLKYGGLSAADQRNTEVAAAAGPDLVVNTPTVSDSSPDAGASFTLSATVRNQGDGGSSSTTLHYYRSTDGTITTSDTSVGTDSVSSLDALETGDESISLTAPDSAGAYYYGACVDAVSGESDATNNCSSAVTVTVTVSSAPDLVVNTPTVSDSSPDAGASFTLSATVRNQGDGGSSSTTLHYYRSTDGTITTSDTSVGTDSVSSLDALETGDESISLTAPDSAGAYYYGACVDAVSGESDATNNCSSAVTVTVTVSSAPDLVVNTPTVSDSSPDAGASFTLSATVRNQGDGGSSSTTLHYYRSTDGTITTSDTSVGTDSVSSLDALETGDESISLTAPDSAGAYYYGACVDAVSGESDATNNCSSAVTVTVTVSSAPDLVVNTPTVSDSSPDAGASFTLSATVRNQGDGGSSSTTLHYYRSTDGTITTSDTSVGTDSVSSLDALETGDESISLTAPNSAGAYYYGACVDAVSGESDATNNCSSAVTVTVTVSSAPDLVVNTPTVSDSSPDAGASFTLSATVRNQGDGGSSSTTLHYYRSTDGTITTSDTSVGTDSVSSLDALETGDESISLTAPDSAGAYYYGACVDAVSGESDATNNCSSAVTVTVTVSSAPDLVVNTPTVSDSSPDAGASFTLSATVRNQGSGSSDSTTLRYYRSTDSSISTSDTEVGTDSVGGLAASGSSPESINLTAPSTAGTYYYGACVDAVSGESDTGNNCSAAVRVSVTAAPAAGTCRVGLVVRPGESCTYPGTTEEFWVDSSGRGRFLVFTADTAIVLRNTNVNGVIYTFVARKQDSGNWLVEEVG